MKTILNIARAELATLFYSPIAWFLLVAFLFQSGLAYYGTMDNYLMQQDLGGEGLRYLTALTGKIFSPPYGIWPGLVGKLYLYLPLLTMGLMSREINGGTIKLLYSSPIRIREIIYGKFLAMMVYNVLLVTILAMLVIFGLFHIHAVDAGLLFSGLFGIYLLLCVYASIGLFMSSLTSYQVVAALSTLVLLAILNYVGTMWQDVDFVRDLTYFLSISGRTDKMLLGLITTKDLLYFLVIIFMFLSFCIYKLKSDRESKSAATKIVRYLTIVVIALAIGYVSSRPGLIGYLDATRGKSMTLTKNAQKILKETGDTAITVTSYINLLDNHFWYGQPLERNSDLDRWEPYLRFKPTIKFNYIYFYDSTADKNLFKYNPGVTLRQLAERYAKSAKIDMSIFKTPAQMKQIIDLRPEENRYVMQLKYQHRKTFLRLFDDQNVYPSETETAAALKRLMQAKLPKIAFVQGELERGIERSGDRHYKMLTNQINFRYSLVNQGFDVETISLQQQEIPDDIAALVIADPKVAFDPIALEKLKKYIASGRNLLIAGEPGKKEILAPLLYPLGVSMTEGMLVEPSGNFAPDLIQSWLTPAGSMLTKKLQQDAEDSLCVTLRGAAALSYDRNGPFTVTPLVMTSEKSSWNKKIKPDEEELESVEDGEAQSGASGVVAIAVGISMAGTAPEETIKKKTSWKGVAFAPQEGDQQGPLPAILALTRMVNGKEQRIIVSGDADFLSNLELSRQNIRTCNFDFSTALFSWFSYGEFPIDTSRPRSLDNRLNLSNGSMIMLKITLLGILPGLLLLAGAILLIRRKRK